MTDIPLISAKGNPIVAEFTGDGIRERLPFEKVHYRAEDSVLKCAKCGLLADVWLESEHRWEEHPNHC